MFTNKKQGRLALTLCALLVGTHVSSVKASAYAFIGEMIWVPYTFAPQGWALCNGQLLSIAQNTALFALLGTQYGGDGKTTFALPDMRGRQLIHAGQGPGLAHHSQGSAGGESSVTLTTDQIPAHTHTFVVSTATATETSPAGHLYAQPTNTQLYSDTASSTLAPTALTSMGSGEPHNNMMPSTTLSCIIALQGAFPPRD